MAAPWAPLGGGMFKVTDYLVQYQSATQGTAQLRPLDTRGGGHVAMSLYYMPRAFLLLLWNRLLGRLAGVHVNMAERASVARKGLIVLMAKLLGTPVLIHLHAAELHRLYQGLTPILQRLVRWVFSAADEVLVLGQASRDFVLTDLRCNPERVHVVINGVPGSRTMRRTERADKPFEILFVGNLTERKGVSDLLEALKKLSKPKGSWHATFAGGGDVEGYRRKVRDMDLDDQVLFFGWARQDQAAQLQANADVLVLPSYDEGLPLVILEALSNGVAVICTPVGEIPHNLKNGRDALFIPPGDCNALAAAIQRLMDEPSLRRSLESTGLAFYRQSFSIEVFFNQIAEAHQKAFGVRATFDANRPFEGHGS